MMALMKPNILCMVPLLNLIELTDRSTFWGNVGELGKHLQNWKVFSEGWIPYSSNGSRTANCVKRILGARQGVKFITLHHGGIPYLGGLPERSKVMLTLYIKMEVGQTIKGGIGKIYLVCYPIFEKKETSCKEVE
jgi:hypothetical protein